jgi:ABC-type phosphate/phosphonate transport system substrate-binding protein
MKSKFVFSAVAALCSVMSANVFSEELRVGIERNSKTNLPVVMTAYEPLANYIKSSGAMKEIRLGIDGVDAVQTSLANQAPALLLVHTHAANAAQATGEYTQVANFEVTTQERLTLLASKASGIDTIKELAGKRVLVGKQGGYVSAATKRLLASQGVDTSTVQFKYVRYADLKLAMLQGNQADVAIVIDKETILAWKNNGGLATPIGGLPTKQLLAHSSVNADTKAKLKKLFDGNSISPGTKAALSTAGLRLGPTSVASAE